MVHSEMTLKYRMAFVAPQLIYIIAFIAICVKYFKVDLFSP